MSFITDDYGTKKYLDKDGKLHNENSPAMITMEGVETWYYHGINFRKDRRFPSEIDKFNKIKKWTNEFGNLDSFENLPCLIIEKTKEFFWFKNGKLHREGDLPAYINEKTGTVRHYFEGKLHREGDFPSIYKKDKNIEGNFENNFFPFKEDSDFCINYFRSSDYIYCKNGLIHRDGDFPAYFVRNNLVYYKNGLIHRDGDLPALINEEEKIWFKNGEKHRDDDLPAFIKPGKKLYFKRNLYHNDFGPAVILDEDIENNIEYTCDYYIEGLKLDKERFLKYEKIFSKSKKKKEKSIKRYFFNKFWDLIYSPEVILKTKKNPEGNPLNGAENHWLRYTKDLNL